MKVLLLKPPDYFYTEENGTSNPQTDGAIFPYSLGVIAQVLRAKLKIGVVVKDSLADEIGIKELKSFIIKEKPNFIVSNVNIVNADSWINDVGSLKKDLKFKFIAVIDKPFGEEFLLKYKFIDVVIFREWLWATLDVIKNWENRYKIKGLYLRQNKSVIFTGNRKCKSVKNYPIPAYDLFPMNRYKNYFSLWSVGCPHHCLFCPFGLYPPKGWEGRKIESIISEINELKKYAKERPLPMLVMDNEITTNPDFIKNICNTIIKEKLDVVVDANTRASSFDEEMAKLMSKAGIINLGLGIESGIQEILDKNNKELTLSQIENTIKLMRKYKIYHRVYIMMGMLGDTSETIWKTYDYVEKLKLKNIGLGITIPYPDTTFYKILKAKGYIKELTMENVKWIYKNVYGYDFITGEGKKPQWKISDELGFDDLIKIYKEMRPKLPEFDAKRFIFYTSYHNPFQLIKWGLKFLKNPFNYKKYIS